MGILIPNSQHKLMRIKLLAQCLAHNRCLMNVPCLWIRTVKYQFILPLSYLVVLCVFPGELEAPSTSHLFADTHSTHPEPGSPRELGLSLASRHQHRSFSVWAHWAGPTVFPTESFTPILTAEPSEPHQYSSPWLTSLSFQGLKLEAYGWVQTSFHPV